MKGDAYMSALIDLTGRKFGRLTVIERAEDKVLPSGGRKTQWLCKCDCGNYTIVMSNNLIRNHTRSCGCLQKEKVFGGRKTHGLSKTRLYRIFNKIRDRCYNPNNPKYNKYGGRGITICDEWLNDFRNFYKWSMANGYKENLTIDRIDGNKGYSPENCRWVDQEEQQNNRSNNHLITYKGETKTLAQWAKELNIKESTIRSRIRYGWSIDKIFETPINNNAVNRKARIKLITYNNETKTLTEWAKEYNIPYKTLYARLARGWEFSKALTTPLSK